MHVVVVPDNEAIAPKPVEGKKSYKELYCSQTSCVCRRKIRYPIMNHNGTQIYFLKTISYWLASEALMKETGTT
jgi:hypothetical protein